MVARAFRKCPISNALDGSKDDALWDADSDKQSPSDDSDSSDK